MKFALVRIAIGQLSQAIDIKIVYNIDFSSYDNYKMSVNIASASGIVTKYRVYTLPEGKITPFVMDQINSLF